jgi:metal-responsive CopG/Arc/MetJ family transcriptional regulator
VKTERVELRMTPSLMRKLDEYRRKHEDLPSRSEAIRQLMELALKEIKNAK